MGKTALYQKYRSATFEEVVGQEYVVKSIRNAIRSDKTGHAYLFCGPRGTGKTTMARLLAKSVNCENKAEAPCGRCPNCIAAMNGSHPDIIEINAANETHVENIRELIERSRLAPMQGKYKIYIIDEVHQLSSAASSALLKTLEEPPENVIFILATTDPQKLLPTIISRCQRFDFTKVNKYQIRNHLLKIAQKENIYLEKEAAEMIAELSEGGMRDALSILDQCAAYTEDHITLQDIDQIYGLTTTDEKIALIHHINRGEIASILDRMEEYEQRGIDLERFTDGLIEILKESTVYARTGNKELLRLLDEEQAEDLAAEKTGAAYLAMAQVFLETKKQFRFSSNAVSCLEIACLTLMNDKPYSVPVPVQKPEEHAVRIKETPQKKPAETQEKVSVPEPETAPEKPSIQEENDSEETSLKKSEEHAGMVQEEPRIFSGEELLKLLVQCNKKAKTEAGNTFMHVLQDVSMEDQKYAVLLNQCTVAAAGENCMILSVNSQSVANRINDRLMNEQLYLFLKRNTDSEKMIYAVPEQVYKEAVRLFVEHRKAGTLPQPMEIVKYEENTPKELTPEEKVINLFGKDNVTIIGGNGGN